MLCILRKYLSGGTKIKLIPIILLFIVVSFFHLWQISDIPKGFYVDELSIGYNALLIARTGYDEHNQFLPIFFEAFGEFKNPLYIYTVSLIYKLFGISEFGLRFASFLFFLLFLLGFYLLITNIFSNNRTISIYVLISAGFMPWFFTLSRIAFEVISQLTMVSFSLLFIYKSYHSDQTKHEWLYPSLAGLSLGLSVYSYSTARLLSFPLLLSLMITYLRRVTFKKSIVILITFLLSIIPYVSFSIKNPDALAKRFKEISYLYNSSISTFDKITIFMTNYASHVGLDFLLFNGDKNLRHATGYGGEIFIIVFVLFVIGLVWLIAQKKLFKNKFLLFILVNLLFSPIAGSLTTGTTALRSILLGLYILVFSCYGLSYLLLIKEKMKQNILIIAVFVILLFQVCLYLNDYFTNYEEKSIAWFESFDFKNTLITAIEQNPEQIIVSNMANRPYVLLEFYKNFVGNSHQIPIYLGNMIPQNNSCIIYFEWNEPILNMYPYNFKELSPHNSVVKLRCY